jgi:glutamine synthetase
MELKSLFASELEFHLFNESQESAREKGWKELKTPQHLHQWMNIQASSLMEPMMRKIRNGLEGAG